MTWGVGWLSRLCSSFNQYATDSDRRLPFANSNLGWLQRRYGCNRLGRRTNEWAFGRRKQFPGLPVCATTSDVGDAALRWCFRGRPAPYRSLDPRRPYLHGLGALCTGRRLGCSALPVFDAYFMPTEAFEDSATFGASHSLQVPLSDAAISQT